MKDKEEPIEIENNKSFLIPLENPYIYTMIQEKQRKYSIIDYLQIEEKNEFKSEFSHGFITAMSGGTLNHSIIGNNINTALNSSLSLLN